MVGKLEYDSIADRSASLVTGASGQYARQDEVD
jgi:hypothetical protein